MAAAWSITEDEVANAGRRISRHDYLQSLHDRLTVASPLSPRRSAYNLGRSPTSPKLLATASVPLLALSEGSDSLTSPKKERRMSKSRRSSLSGGLRDSTHQSIAEEAVVPEVMHLLQLAACSVSLY